jgi:hypothetical protein
MSALTLNRPDPTEQVAGRAPPCLVVKRSRLLTQCRGGMRSTFLAKAAKCPRWAGCTTLALTLAAQPIASGTGQETTW